MSSSSGSKSDEKGIDTSLTQDFRISKDNELRFEVETNERVKLDLVDGSAEIFGTELVRSRYVSLYLY